MTYRTTVGITVFGEPIGYSADVLISEFQSFVMANSQFDLVVTVNKYSALADEEICFSPYANCNNGYWPASSCLHANTKEKFATNVQINMMLFDTINKPVCFGGACECWDSINGVPLVMIPLGAWPDADNSPGGPWIRALSQTLVHEWMHGIDYILEQLGYPAMPSVDNCTQYGYTGDNDPGWANCLAYFLSFITTDAYIALENWNPQGTISIITTPVSGRIYIDGIYKSTGSWTETLSIGNHTVYFGIVSGYTTPSQRMVTINAGQTTYVMGVYTLISTTGSVRFYTSPDTAEVWSGTTLLGTTDSSGILLVSNLPTGNLDFVIKKIRYNDSPIQTVTVVADSTIDTPLITLSPMVATAGFGSIGMIMIVGIAIGAIYNSAKNNNKLLPIRK